MKTFDKSYLVKYIGIAALTAFISFVGSFITAMYMMMLDGHWPEPQSTIAQTVIWIFISIFAISILIFIISLILFFTDMAKDAKKK